MKLTLMLGLLVYSLLSFAANLEEKSYYQYLDYDAIELNDINTEDIVGETALHRAAAAGDGKAVEELIKDGANPEALDIDGQSPIFYSLASGENATALLLVIYDRTIYDESDFLGRSAYDFAGELEGEDLQEIMSGGHNLFHVYGNSSNVAKSLERAVKSGDLGSLRYAIEFLRVDSQYTDQSGESLLHMAAYSKKISLIEYLCRLLKDSKPLFVNMLQQTPLHIAIEYNFIEAIDSLVKLNPDQLFVYSGYYSPRSTPYKVAQKRDNQDAETKLHSLLYKMYDVENKFNNTYAMMAWSEISNEQSDKTNELLSAIAKRDVEVAPLYFLFSGANPSKVIQGDFDSNSSISKSGNAFHLAARQKDIELIEIMTKYFNGDINTVSISGHNVISYLLEGKGTVNQVKKLIELGVDPKIGKSSLEQAIALQSLEIFELLVSKEVNPNKLGYQNNSMLMVAAKSNSLPIAERLVEMGLSGDHQNDNGDTALHFAAQYGSLELFNLILQNTTNTNLRNEYKKTPLDIALEFGRQEIVEVLQNGHIELSFDSLETALYNGEFDLAEMIVSQGQIDLDQVISRTGWSLLHKATYDFDQTKTLMDNLVEAKKIRITEIIKFLVKYKATLDFQDRNGQTPLHQAVIADNYELVELFLKLGANPNIKTKNGKNSVKLSESKKVYKLLKKYGADGKRFFW